MMGKWPAPRTLLLLEGNTNSNFMEEYFSDYLDAILVCEYETNGRHTQSLCYLAAQKNHMNDS